MIRLYLNHVRASVLFLIGDMSRSSSYKKMMSPIILLDILEAHEKYSEPLHNQDMRSAYLQIR